MRIECENCGIDFIMKKNTLECKCPDCLYDNLDKFQELVSIELNSLIRERFEIPSLINTVASGGAEYIVGYDPYRITTEATTSFITVQNVLNNQ